MIILRYCGYSWALMSKQFPPLLTIETLSSTGWKCWQGFLMMLKIPVCPHAAVHEFFHGIVHAVFNDPWKCSRQIHVFFMAFLRSMKNLSWLWAKFHFVGDKRKHEPWKFHLRWIKQRHPHKQNFNTSKMISSFSLGCQTVMGVFSQTI